ncbi:MAG TPA: peptidoglycan editing factor PgeF [Saprospiraceae bacterium]|nr:peptidoglycan editing factor PgeF [Saprospiraceae bacterium]
MLRRPSVFAPFPHLIAAESTRHGGVSPAPYASLNLGKGTDDAPEHVSENRRRFCHALGFEPQQLAFSRQVHGAEVLRADGPGGASGFDALISDVPGVVLAVSVADCTPILVYDARTGAVAAIHAGWRGTVAGIVDKALRQMAEAYGTRGADCYAYVGTCIDECSFEVGHEVAAAFAADFKRWDAERGKYLVDLKRANAAQLLGFGVEAQRVQISPYSTVSHRADYFSHRMEGGVTGRMMAVIGRRAG